MGCLCNQVTTSTVNCGTCGYNCTSCVCPPDPIVMPEVTCEDPNPCNELYPLECLIYTGADIKCSTESLFLYPDVIHYLVLEEFDTKNRNFVDILKNINEQLCYIFSKDFITQLLINIQNDEELSLLFCNIVSNCDCECNLTCPSVTSATYNTYPVSVDTITINFNQSIDGSSINFSGTISGTTLTVTTPPISGSISAGVKITGTGISPNTFITSGAGSTWTVSVSQSVTTPIVITGTKTIYTAAIYRSDINNTYVYVANTTNILFPTNTTAIGIVSVTAPYDNTTNNNWMVSVFAEDGFVESCTAGYLTTGNQPINYDLVKDNCGVGLYTAPVEQNCREICINDDNNNIVFFVNPDTSLNFTFTTQIIPSGYYPVTKYTVHWYEENSNGVYTAQYGWSYEHSGIYGPTTVTLTTTLTGTNAYTNNYLVLILAETENPECYSGLPPRLPLTNDGPVRSYLEDEIKDFSCNVFKFIYQEEPPVIN